MEQLIANFKSVQKKQYEDWDYTITIVGGKRKSKSTLGYHIAKIFNPKFSPEMMDYSLDGLRHRTETCPDKSVVFADETIRALHKGDWNKDDQKDFEGIFFNVGDKNIIFIMITQMFEEFPKWFRKAVDCKIYVPSRGRAIVRLRLEREFEKEPYFKKVFEDTFPDLDPATKKYYKEVKRKKLKDAWGNESKFWRLMYNLRKEGVPYGTLSKASKISRSTIYRKTKF